MDFNVYILFAAALVPLVVGSLWYNNALFGKAWLKSANLNADVTKTGNMLLIFGLTYVFSLFLAFGIAPLIIHQMGFFQMLQASGEFAQEGSDVYQLYNSVMSEYGSEFRTLQHGALHGGFAAVTIVLPIVGIISLFERRGWSYIFIHLGYWFVTLLIMGALIGMFM